MKPSWRIVLPFWTTVAFEGLAGALWLVQWELTRDLG